MPNNSSQFITCPKCNGLGKTDQNLVCNECGGTSLGTFIKNDFLYWGYDLTPAKIILRHSKIFFNYFIISACFLLGLSGIFSLIWWIKNNAFINGYQINIGILLSFWGEQAGLILFFWAGILCLLFIYFFYHRLHNKKTRVKKLNYYEQEKLKQNEQEMPNNWQELKNFKVKIDVSQSYEKDLLKIIEDGYELALNKQHQELLPIHIIATLLAKQDVKQKEPVQQFNFILKRLGIFKGKIEPKVQKILEKIPVAKEKNITPVVSRELRQSLIEAYLSAFDAQQEQVGLPNLIGYLIDDNKYGVDSIFNELQINLDKIEMVAIWSIMHDHFYKEKELKENIFWRKMQEKMQKATTAVATPLLNHFCVNITQKVKFNPDGIIVDNEDALNQIFDSFKQGKKQIVIKGAKGSGKTSVLANLAERIINNEVPYAFKDVQLLQLNLRKFLTEAPELTLEKKMLGLVAELKHAYRVILVIDNTPLEIVNLLKSYQNTFSYIMTINQVSDELVDMSVVDLSELSEEILIQILISRALLIEKKYKVYFDYDALDLTVEAVRIHLADFILPSTAVDILKQAAEQASQADRKVDKRLIAKIISAQANVPFTKVLKQIN